MAFTRSILSKGKLTTDSSGNIYNPSSGEIGLVHNIVLFNGNTSAENIVISLNDGTNDYVLFKIGLSADDTYILDFGGEGMVVPYGYTLKGYTTIADTVNYVIFGTKEI